MISIFNNVIKWPIENNIKNIIHSFTCLKLWLYLDKVIGVIDESYIKINSCVEYINHKKFYSLILLDMINVNEKFTYVYIEKSGFIYNSKVFRRLSLSLNLF